MLSTQTPASTAALAAAPAPLELLRHNNAVLYIRMAFAVLRGRLFLRGARFRLNVNGAGKTPQAHGRVPTPHETRSAPSLGKVPERSPPHRTLRGATGIFRGTPHYVRGTHGKSLGCARALALRAKAAACGGTVRPLTRTNRGRTLHKKRPEPKSSGLLLKRDKTIPRSAVLPNRFGDPERKRARITAPYRAVYRSMRLFSAPIFYPHARQRTSLFALRRFEYARACPAP